MKWLVLLLFVAACGSSEPDPAAQEVYGEYLEVARTDVEMNPERCVMSTWDEFISSLGSASAEDPLIRAALLDACIEAGEIDSEHSAFYAKR